MRKEVQTITADNQEPQDTVQQDITPQELFGSSQAYKHNSLKIMDGKFGGGFYVKYLQDEGSKTGFLQLIIEYPDMQCKTVLLCKNVFKEASCESDGIGTIEKGTGENATTLTPLRSSSFKDGDYRILEKYETPQMPIPAQALWKQIIDNYHRIPLTSIYKTEGVEGMYWELYRIARSKSEGYSSGTVLFENEVRFLVDKDEMEKVAAENGYTLAQLRTELNLLGLLIKDKGSTAKSGKCYNSYQLTKKVDGDTKRFYALKKTVKKPSGGIDASCCVGFSEEYLKTPAEISLEGACKNIENLKQEVEEKKNEITALYLHRIDDITQEELLTKVL